MTRLLAADHPTGLQEYNPPTLEQLKLRRTQELNCIRLSDFVLMASGEAILLDKKRENGSGTHRDYTADEEKYLQDERGKGTTYREIAKVIGRTTGAVQARAVPGLRGISQKNRKRAAFYFHSQGALPGENTGGDQSDRGAHREDDGRRSNMTEQMVTDIAICSFFAVVFICATVVFVTWQRRKGK